MILQDIRSAMLTAVRTALGANVPTELENIAFTPTPGALWISVAFLPVSDTPKTLGASGENELLAIFQVTINVPLNTGETTLQNCVNNLRTYLTPGKSLTYGAATVRLREFNVSPPRQADVWYRRTVSIQYYTRLTRP